MKPKNLKDFVRESNMIENIHREPSEYEIEATADFLCLEQITVPSLEHLVSVYAPGNVLRREVGRNVVVGNHVAPRGGPAIEPMLDYLLARINTHLLHPYQGHCEYETLHPFTDGNGRSGRAVWLWAMQGEAPLGFLHHWYYQSLQNLR